MKVLRNIKNEKILFSPLNWGWGHVSRSIMLLKKLQAQGNTIIIACQENQGEVFKEYLTHVEYLRWEGYPFEFGDKGNFASDMAKSYFKLKSFGKKETVWVEEKVKELNVSVVLSEHRYYFHSNEVKSIFITHQLNLPLPWYLRPVQKVHQKLILKFDHIWVMDDETLHLSGKLGVIHPWCAHKANYIGLFSRFMNDTDRFIRAGSIVVVSGPEAHADSFYLAQQKIIETRSVGILHKGFFEKDGVKSKVTWLEMDELIRSADLLISRSGYSTLMDIYFLKCKSELQATPGQWEQEYLMTIQ